MKSPVRKAVIPAAGLGTRFLPVTKVVPKELLPIGARPSLEFIVDEAVSAGIDEIVLVVSPLKIGIADYFRPDTAVDRALELKGKGDLLADLYAKYRGIRFTTAIQEEAKGLGHAVLCAREAVGDAPFMVFLPDDLVFTGKDPTVAEQMVSLYEKHPDQSVIALFEVPPEDVVHYGVAAGRSLSPDVISISQLVEKPRPEAAPSRLAIVGRYLLSPKIFLHLAAIRPGRLGEIQLTDGLAALARENSLLGYRFKGQRCDTGVPLGLLMAGLYHFRENPELRAFIKQIGLS